MNEVRDLVPFPHRMYRVAADIVLGAALAILVLELAAAVVVHVAVPSQFGEPSPGVGPPLADSSVTGASSPYLATASWGTRHWRELDSMRRHSRYEPYVMWRRTPVQGETITIDSLGNRRTPGSECVPGALRVFVFGGSTTWGYGVPDWATIPAFLQRELSARLTNPVCVVNYGELGYTSTQSLVQLMVRLRDGDAPRVAISYDGVNDITTADLYDEAGLHGDMNAYGRRFEVERAAWWEAFAIGQLAHHLLGVGHARPRDRYRHTLGVSPPWLAERTASVYLANHEMARTLARDFGFEYLAFWQPNVLVGKKPLTREEAIMRDAGRPGRRVSSAFIADVYGRVRKAAESADGLHYIADIFEGDSRLLYVDWQHLVPEANELVARRMMRALQESGILEAAP